MIPLLLACSLGFLVAPRQLAPPTNNGLIGVATVLGITALPAGLAAGPRYNRRTVGVYKYA